MGDKSSLLRALPRVDDVLAHAQFAASSAEAPRVKAREAARDAVDELRRRVLADESPDVSLDAVARRAEELLARALTRSLRRTVNAAGVILHTNLGRAPLAPAAQEALADVAAGYCNLQADPASGQRSERESHVEGLFRQITGAEAALVVNNNAAATVLVLNTLGAGREVICSRGEMVEIGGAFRIPDIMKLAGCKLVEVGCTNRTHLRDYERAITADTALLLAVHQSNYRIVGFAGQAPVEDLAALAHKRGLVCAHDLGSGALMDLRRYGLPPEPNVPESLAAGADVVLFSGDKLIGGPQCGIILGKAAVIAAMRKNPYYRAFRVCKLTLAALEGTLRLYLDPDRLAERHPLWAMLTGSVEEVRRRAEALSAAISRAGAGAAACEVVATESEIGGGSLAGYSIPTVAVKLQIAGIAPADVAQRLRLGDPPVFTRVHDDAVWIDPRTMLPGEEDLLLRALKPLFAAPVEGACCPLKSRSPSPNTQPPTPP